MLIIRVGWDFGDPSGKLPLLGEGLCPGIPKSGGSWMATV